MLKIRLFLVYLFGSDFFDEFGIFYSHFEMIKKYKNLVICVYFYYGFLEGVINDFFFDNWIFFRKAVFSKEKLTFIKRPV